MRGSRREISDDSVVRLAGPRTVLRLALRRFQLGYELNVGSPAPLGDARVQVPRRRLLVEAGSLVAFGAAVYAIGREGLAKAYNATAPSDLDQHLQWSRVVGWASILHA